MKNQMGKVERLVGTMKNFLEKRATDRVMYINDRMPPRQRRAMVSLIRQAKKIDETQL